jgi:hypothetical protein
MKTDDDQDNDCDNDLNTHALRHGEACTCLAVGLWALAIAPANR